MNSDANPENSTQSRRGKHGQTSHTAYFHETVRHILIQHMEKYERGYETIVNMMMQQARKDGVSQADYDKFADFWRPEYVRAIVRTGRFVSSDMLEPLVAFLQRVEPERCQLLDLERALTRFGQTLADMVLLSDDQRPFRQAAMRQGLQVPGILVSNLTSYEDHSEIQIFEDTQFIALAHVSGQPFLRVHVIRADFPRRVCSGIALVSENEVLCFVRENDGDRHFHMFSLLPSDGRFAKKARMTVRELSESIGGIAPDKYYKDFNLLHAPVTDWLINKHSMPVDGRFMSINDFVMSARAGDTTPMRGTKLLETGHYLHASVTETIDRLQWKMS